MIDLLISLLVLICPGSVDYSNNEWRYNGNTIACADSEDSIAHECGTYV